MARQIIRLTESDLHKIIKESVKRIIYESNAPTPEDLEIAKQKMQALRGKKDKKMEFFAAAQEYQKIKELLGKANFIKQPSSYWSDKENEKRGITPSDENSKWRLPGHIQRQKEADKEFFDKTKGENDIDAMLGV